MTASRLEAIRQRVERGNLEELFVDMLGWAHVPPRSIRIPGVDFQATQVAHKRGVGVWRIEGIPTGQDRRRIDAEVSKATRERLLVFVEDGHQLWLWPEQRASGAGFRLIEHDFYPKGRNEGLLQRLDAASFKLEEESQLTVMDVLARVRKSFNADEVTKRFYRDFKNHHDELLGQIDGIGQPEHISWYGSVLLNRLMFIYFMQKKGFLDNDRDYLRNRLERVRTTFGKDAFYGFYRKFLLPLFHDGLGSHVHEYPDEAIAGIIGDVPFVNGGIFSPHLLEKTYEINVPDQAFEEIFTFFDRYRWHLDERPTEDPNEINPDVLGYIFEQYVNQKEQGAYYTKEDVTGYMTGATVIPAFFDKLGSDHNPCALLSLDPDRYIYESVRYGEGEDLPSAIAEGIDDPSKRAGWTEKAPPSHGLPGETWWEVNDRRRYCQDLRARLAADEIQYLNAAITANLDLRTLAIDYLRMLAPIEDVEKAFQVLADLTILDPTSGSGAFLFAALEILADLYEALLERAEELTTAESRPEFLIEARKHPNPAYFILKSALLNNLYGVDIMYEAGEIARLRLFLKLVAQIDRRDQLEPLPDLDFNIRTGNLLVGIADLSDARDRIGSDLLGSAMIDEIEAAASAASDAYDLFIQAQQDPGNAQGVLDLKAVLIDRLNESRRELDRLLYQSLGESVELEEWVESHQPFHWFAEFPKVFRNGAFDVVVGNPPYINRDKVTRYKWRGLRTNDLPDIFAPCLERSIQLLNGSGRFSMILPISFQFSDDFRLARDAVASDFPEIWVSTFSRNPAALFTAGLGVRSTIVVGNRAATVDDTIRVTKLNRWVDEYRPFLFQGLRYTDLVRDLRVHGWPRLENEGFGKLFGALAARRSSLGEVVVRSGEEEVRFKSTALYYLSVFLDDPPSFNAKGLPIPQTKVGTLRVATPADAEAVVAALLGKIALAWWAATSDDFDVTGKGLASTPIGPSALSPELWASLAELGRELHGRLPSRTIYTKYAGKWMGNYDVKYFRDLTDQADRLILSALHLDTHWHDLELFYAGFLKVTGERPGTLREVPTFE